MYLHLMQFSVTTKVMRYPGENTPKKWWHEVYGGRPWLCQSQGGG
jgi:hypothetical protein